MDNRETDYVITDNIVQEILHKMGPEIAHYIGKELIRLAEEKNEDRR